MADFWRALGFTLLMLVGSAIIAGLLRFIIRHHAFHTHSKTFAKKTHRQQSMIQKIFLLYTLKYNRRGLTAFTLILYFVFCISSIIILLFEVVFQKFPQPLSTISFFLWQWSPMLSIVSLAFNPFKRKH